MTEPTVGRTSLVLVVSVGLGGAGISWLLTNAALYAGWGLPVLGFSAWAVPLVFAVWISWLAYSTTRELKVNERIIRSRVAVTRLYAGKASILAGAALGAAYGVLVFISADGWPAPLAQARVLHSALAVLTCIAWAIAGWVLERACRIPPDKDAEAGAA